VKRAKLKAMLNLAAYLDICPLFHTYSPVWLKFGIRHLQINANEEDGMVSQNTTVIFGGAFYLG
jgi:hypothetical protein